MVVPFVYTEEEYKKLEEENRNLKNELMEDMKTETKLNEEIKKLKSDLAYERTMLDNVKAEYENLQEINKKLKSREEKLMAYYKWYVDKEHNLTDVEDIITENIKLKERIRFLEQCLDNKEKVNKSLREEIGKLVMKQ